MTPLAVMIVSSSRFYDRVREVAAELTRLGHEVRTPSLEHDETRADVGPDLKRRLTREALAKIDESEVLYVVCPGGYVGTSVALEVGYACAGGLAVLVSDVPTDPAVTALTCAPPCEPAAVCDVVDTLYDSW